MGKLLFWLLVGFALVAWYKFAKNKRKAPPPASTPGVEDMVRCKVCGVNLPRSEAILSQGRFYCCPEHREQDRG